MRPLANRWVSVRPLAKRWVNVTGGDLAAGVLRCLRMSTGPCQRRGVLAMESFGLVQTASGKAVRRRPRCCVDC